MTTGRVTLADPLLGRDARGVEAGLLASFLGADSVGFRDGTRFTAGAASTADTRFTDGARFPDDSGFSAVADFLDRGVFSGRAVFLGIAGLVDTADGLDEPVLAAFAPFRSSRPADLVPLAVADRRLAAARTFAAFRRKA